MALRTLLPLLGLLLITLSLRADDKRGLKEGSDLPGPFRPYHVVNGKYEGKFHCPVCDHGLNPGVLVFVKNLDFKNEVRWKPLQALLKGLDTYTSENPKARHRATVVFHHETLPDVVTDDDARVALAGEIRQQKGDLAHVVLTLDSLPRLQKGQYDLDPAAEAVVVLYNQMKVHKIFRTVGEKDVAAILAEVRERLAPVKK